MKAEVFFKNNCPFCVRAKELLRERGIEFDEIEAVSNREVLIERVTAATGFAPKTVPQIFLDGQHIGGYDDLVEYFNNQTKEQSN